jgi:Tol biopolymer transport system component
MNDERMDLLVRRLDVESAPPPAFVAETYEFVRPHAAAASRRWLSLAPGRRVRFALVATVALLALLLWALAGVGGPRPGPLGWPAGTIVFGRAHATPQGYDLWTVKLDGSGPQRLASGSFETSRVSNDGKRLEIPVYGNVLFPRIRTLADGTDRDLHPDSSLNLGVAAWSHDGAWLAFEAWDDGAPDRAGVYLMRSDGTELHRLTGAAVPGAFSPDDRQLVMTRQEGLFIVNVDGTNEHQVGLLKPTGYSAAGFMPDGRSIYAAADGLLLVIDLATGIATPFEVPGGSITSPRVSPDGTRFVFSFDAIGAPTTAIWQMRVDGSDPRLVVDDPAANEDFADWLP